GGLSGTLQTGRTLDYINAGDENRKMCSLFLSIMDRMGVKLDQFGDAETRLERLQEKGAIASLLTQCNLEEVAKSVDAAPNALQRSRQEHDLDAAHRRAPKRVLGI